MEQRAIILDHHPADSRTDIADDQNTIQTLTSRMGTGGGNVPMILEYHSQVLRIKPLIVEPITYDEQVTNPLHKDSTQGGVCHTLNSDSGAMYSLNTTEVHAVAYVSNATQTFPKNQSKTSSIIAVLGGGREHSTICMDGTAPTLCTFQDSKPILIARVDNAEIL